MSDSAVKRGWGWPTISREPHYFVNGMSLCGKWMFTGVLESDSDSDIKTTDDCVVCRRKYTEMKPKDAPHA